MDEKSKEEIDIKLHNERARAEIKNFLDSMTVEEMHRISEEASKMTDDDFDFENLCQ
jgi:hypothetical protein